MEGMTDREREDLYIENAIKGHSMALRAIYNAGYQKGQRDADLKNAMQYMEGSGYALDIKRRTPTHA